MKTSHEITLVDSIQQASRLIKMMDITLVDRAKKIAQNHEKHKELGKKVEHISQYLNRVIASSAQYSQSECDALFKEQKEIIEMIRHGADIQMQEELDFIISLQMQLQALISFIAEFTHELTHLPSGEID
ncbi:hypothetical protein [Vibrio viridaestus]|uniref:Uncharacterized protein n=1 Tax=Vibrio viridaestus TaxID=2487322 RepID=A0A3N9TAZ0_9VIBR|nr:hypothetical protein [Vibrio viridaestus]RQW61080.1 hypothetical protein EES38_21260 [Vibrio viridaestus]